MRRFSRQKNVRALEMRGDGRLKFLLGLIFIFAAVLVWRLFTLQILDKDFYSALAAGQHEIYQSLFPERGKIWMSEISGDNNKKELYPLATNQALYLVYADTRKIKNPEEVAKQLSEIFKIAEDQAGEEKKDEAADPEALAAAKEETDKAAKEKLKGELLEKLKKENDPYEPLRNRVAEEEVKKIGELKIEGIGFADEDVRFYPEKNVGSHILGFLGFKDDKKVGQYGLEGYFDKELAGKQGFLASEKDVAGRWIPVSGRKWDKAEDGSDLVLTIDRNIEFFACDALQKAVKKHGADGGSVIVMDPKTGAVLAMCSYPDFDPNEYSKVKDINVFNNPAIFYQYEPGSIFKAITIAAALDLEKVTPTTTYNDEGFIKVDDRTIKNSDEKAHGIQTMTDVLDESLNTGAVYAVQKIGAEAFKKYVEDFGFGAPTGVGLDFENKGNISSLGKRGDIWSATGSFGQGISVTPIQVVSAFSAIANGGKLVKPYIVDEIRKSNGEVVKTGQQVVRQVISSRTATLLGGMLASVVEHGHGKKAGVPGYFVAGKTGTAQVAKKDGSGYEKDVTVGSFVGFAPVEDPKFVMLAKIDHPRDTIWAEATAAPLFGEIAKFMLNYFKVPPSR